MSKLQQILTYLESEKLDVAVVSDPVTINYLTGFYSDPHERQMFLFVYENREPALFVPALEVARASAVLDFPVFGYVAKRFSAFFNPFNDLSGAGHQLANSYYAMSNGGWFGLGLGNSIEKQGYLPEAHTDFVFAIVIEELGFVGASLILALLFFLILRIILVGIRAKNPFNSMMAIGIGGMILVQTFINIGGISGLIPSTGVTFPFLSQGGNSLWVLSVAIAFVLNIDASEKRAKMEQEGMVFEEKGKIKPYY